MNWRRGKKANVAYLIGYEGEQQNGYKVVRTFSQFRVLFTGCYRGKPILSDTSCKLAQRACEDHALSVRQPAADAAPVLPAVHGGSQPEAHGASA